MARNQNSQKAQPKTEWQAQQASRPSRLADQLYGQILDRILSGAMVEGEKLPSESRLCELYGVSRPVVREALSRLQADKVLVSRHGSGSFVQRRPQQAIPLLAPIGDIAELMRCMEFRIGLEGEAAYLAATRRSDADLTRMKRALDALEDVIAKGEVGHVADQNFHLAIATAAQNRLFVQTMSVLAEHTLKGMELARKLSLRQSARRLQLVQQEHSRILSAIEAEEPDEAREAMRVHIENARLRVLSDSTEP